jgi:hypothetical protein
MSSILPIFMTLIIALGAAAASQGSWLEWIGAFLLFLLL